jgi:hypothetical protein
MYYICIIKQHKTQRNEKPNHHQDSNPIRVNSSDSHAVIIMQQH